MEEIFIKWVFTWIKKSNKIEALKWAKNIYKQITCWNAVDTINKRLIWIQFTINDLRW